MCLALCTLTKLRRRVCLQHGLPNLALEVFKASKSTATSKGEDTAVQLRIIALRAAVLTQDLQLGERFGEMLQKLTG